jgi:hypothetical protein
VKGLSGTKIAGLNESESAAGTSNSTITLSAHKYPVDPSSEVPIIYRLFGFRTVGVRQRTTLIVSSLISFLFARKRHCPLGSDQSGIEGDPSGSRKS